MAAVVWYVGAAVLSVKGLGLLAEADSMKPEEDWTLLGTVVGVFFGGLKANLLFKKSCQKNLDRIDALHHPRMWQFFSPGFFLALAIMILFGMLMFRLAPGDYTLLIAFAVLDIAIATALLWSSVVFWKQRVFWR